jgi:membrane protease YdiL (CAAX protease family)
MTTLRPKPSGRRMPQVWTMMLLPPALLAGLIAVYAALSGWRPDAPGAQETLRPALPAILAVNHLTLFSLLVLLLRRNGETLSNIGWSARRVGSTLTREMAIGLICALALYLLKEFVFDSVQAILAGHAPTFMSLFRVHLRSDDVGWLLAGTTLVFVEESIYRGYALPFLRTRWGAVPAVAATSMAFALLHWGQGLRGMIHALFAGALLAGVFLWRRNMIAGTAAHAFYNLALILTAHG